MKSKKKRFIVLILTGFVFASALGKPAVSKAEEYSAGNTRVRELTTVVQDDLASLYKKKVENARTINKMRATVWDLTQQFGGYWSVYFKRMDTGAGFCLNEMEMIAASTIKLYVYGAVMDQIEKGKAPAGAYDEELWEMITYSSNEAWYYLTDVFGTDKIQKFIEKNGFKHTELARFVTTLQEKENFTDVYDLGTLLEKVLRGTYVSKDTSAALLEALQNQFYTHKIPAGLPANVKTGNKTGELEEMEHDAAIVYSPECTYILVIMTTGADPNKVFAQYKLLSHVIYAMLNGSKEPVRQTNYEDFFDDDEGYDDYYYWDDYWNYYWD